MPPKAANAKPGQPLTTDPEVENPGTTDPDPNEEPREVSLEGLQAIVESLSMRLDDQDEEIGQLRAEVRSLQRNQPQQARGGPRAPELTVEQAQAEANKRGKSVLSAEGWVAPKVAA